MGNEEKEPAIESTRSAPPRAVASPHLSDAIGDGFHLELKQRMGQRAERLHKADGGLVAQLAVVAAEFMREEMTRIRRESQYSSSKTQEKDEAVMEQVE